jgi:hypothetical protein
MALLESMEKSYEISTFNIEQGTYQVHNALMTSITGKSLVQSSYTSRIFNLFHRPAHNPPPSPAGKQ